MKLCALGLGLLMSTTSCSLLVDNRADQCASDGDCALFSGTFCDLGVRLCKPLDPSIAASTHSEAGAKEAAAGTDASTVSACSATTFENACTNATCKPFNNRVRLIHLPLDGGLTPVPIRDSGSYDGGRVSEAATADAARIDASIQKSDADVDDGWRNEASTDDAGRDGE